MEDMSVLPIMKKGPPDALCIPSDSSMTALQ